MKPILIFFALLLSGISCALEVPVQESYGSLPLPQCCFIKPISFAFAGDAIFESKVHVKDAGQQFLRFSVSAIEYADSHRLQTCHIEHIGFSLAYVMTRLGWDGNPYFGKKLFNTGSVTLFGCTNRLANWDWKGFATANADFQHLGIGDYLNFDLLLWGRYRYSSGVGMHVGVLGFTGMHINRVYPIVGVDWQINPRWKLSLVYPVNVSVLYTLNCNWSVGAAGRYFFSRHRAGNKNRFPRAIFFYRAIGAEAFIDFQCDSCFTANLHAGCAFDAKLTLANQHYSHRKTYSIDPAPYAGCELSYNF